MAEYGISDIQRELGIPLKNGEGIIGIQYSILTWSATLSDREKITSRLFNNGYAECFLLEKTRTRVGLRYVSSGIDDKWVFNSKNERGRWLKKKEKTDTFVYYVKVNAETVRNFDKAVKKLKKEKVTYSVANPNYPGSKTRFENCVSSSHKLLEEVGIGWSHKGWWMPSIDSWAQWFASKIPFPI